MSLRLSSLSALPAVAALIFLAACTTPAVIAGSSGGSGGGGGSTATGTTSTSTSATATSSAGTGGSGGGDCSGYIDVIENGAAPVHFAALCSGFWGSNETMTAVGYHFAGGAAPGADEVEILGCATTMAGSPGLHLSTPKVSATGTFTDGSADYTAANGVTLTTGLDPYSVVITRFDGPGGVIEGTFSGSVTGPTDAKKTLTATFHVCRVADELVP